MRRFFELKRHWGEENWSISIDRNAGSRVRHLDVYKSLCDTAFVKNYSVLSFKEGVDLDCIPNNLGWIIVSPRCRAIFENVSANTKAFMAPIAKIVPRSSHFDPIREYTLLSSAAIFDCLDISDSRLTWYDKSKLTLQKHDQLRLVESKIQAEASFFSILNVPVGHVVSEKLRNDLLIAKVTGITFRECEMI